MKTHETILTNLKALVGPFKGLYRAVCTPPGASCTAQGPQKQSEHIKNILFRNYKKYNTYLYTQFTCLKIDYIVPLSI